MKLSSLILSAAGAAALLAVPAAASAADRDCHRGWCDYGDRYDARDRHDAHERWERERREAVRDRRAQERAYRKGYREGRRQEQHRGRYIPRGANYRVIEDYSRYGYSQPPRGYQYAEVDGEVLMVQIATQLIAQALTQSR